MRYALYISSPNGDHPSEDKFCVLESSEDVSNQVHDPSFGLGRFLLPAEINQIEHGFPIEMLGDCGYVCIRPFQ